MAVQKPITITAPKLAAIKSMEALRDAAVQRKAEYEQALSAHTAALEQHNADLDGFVREIVEADGKTFDGKNWSLSADGTQLEEK